MFWAKNLLLGLGGTVVVGGGGYMIYNATKSGNNKEKENIEENENSSVENNGKGSETSVVKSQAPVTPASTTGSTDGNKNE